MGRKVLLVGHCVPDTSRISRVLQKLDLNYESAQSVAEGLEKLREGEYDLALPNRVIGGNEEGGVNFIHGMKAETELSTIPVMLISAIPAAQQEAQSAGATIGFGKDDLETGGAEKKIRQILSL